MHSYRLQCYVISVECDSTRWFVMCIECPLCFFRQSAAQIHTWTLFSFFSNFREWDILDFEGLLLSHQLQIWLIGISSQVAKFDHPKFSRFVRQTGNPQYTGILDLSD